MTEAASRAAGAGRYGALELAGWLVGSRSSRRVLARFGRFGRIAASAANRTSFIMMMRIMIIIIMMRIDSAHNEMGTPDWGPPISHPPILLLRVSGS